MNPVMSEDHSKIREAVAIAYRESDAAPRIVAKGKGLIADEIMARAKEHGVYVHESRELLSLLTQIDLDQHIPANLYAAVAELLAWIYRMEHSENPRHFGP
jgi:flagellar biosynthesis protein